MTENTNGQELEHNRCEESSPKRSRAETKSRRDKLAQKYSPQTHCHGEDRDRPSCKSGSSFPCQGPMGSVFNHWVRSNLQSLNIMSNTK